MSSENPKRRIYSQIATLLRSLAHENRLELLEILGQGEWSVEDLARRSSMSVANASQHLQLLRQSGLVESRRLGKHVLYQLTHTQVTVALSAMSTLASASLAAMKLTLAQEYQSLDPVEPISMIEAKSRLASGDLFFLDLRDIEEYRQGHVSSAAHIPFRELEDMLAALPKDREIIAYCRGPFCALSFKTVQILRRHGFNCRRLQDGFPEWKAGGGNVDIAAAFPA